MSISWYSHSTWDPETNEHTYKIVFETDSKTMYEAVEKLCRSCIDISDLIRKEKEEE